MAEASRNSSRVGYWARYHDLEFKDVGIDMNVREFLGLDEDEFNHEEFQEGWDECDRELTEERIEALKASLDER